MTVVKFWSVFCNMIYNYFSKKETLYDRRLARVIKRPC